MALCIDILRQVDVLRAALTFNCRRFRRRKGTFAHLCRYKKDFEVGGIRYNKCLKSFATNDITQGSRRPYIFEEYLRGRVTVKGSRESSLFKPRRHIKSDSMTAAVKERDRWVLVVAWPHTILPCSLVPGVRLVRPTFQQGAQCSVSLCGKADVRRPGVV